MQIEKIAADKMRAAEYNPRKDLKSGDAEYEKLRRSIEVFGYVEPVIWNKQTGNIIGGHQRFKVLRDMGVTEIDCVVVDLNDKNEKALNLALNKISGSWDNDKLEALLREIDTDCFDVSVTGFDAPEMAALFRSGDLAGVREDDFDEEPPEEPFTRAGDVWQLGRHRLICGDASRPETYSALMGGRPAALVVTDPPYNVAYEGVAGAFENDNLNSECFRKFLMDAFTAMYGSLEDGGSIYVFHSDRETVSFHTAFAEAGFFAHQTCVWVKNSAVMGRCDYQFDYEPILYGWKPTAGHRWYADRKQRTVWNFDRPAKSKLHPTTKPVALMAYPIVNSSMQGDVVLDPFGGSGSTLIACEQTGRSCYMIEIDRGYVDVIVSRYVAMCGGEEVVLMRGGEQLPWNCLEAGAPGR